MSTETVFENSIDPENIKVETEEQDLNKPNTCELSYTLNLSFNKIDNGRKSCQKNAVTTDSENKLEYVKVSSDNSIETNSQNPWNLTRTILPNSLTRFLSNKGLGVYDKKLNRSETFYESESKLKSSISFSQNSGNTTLTDLSYSTFQKPLKECYVQPHNQCEKNNSDESIVIPNSQALNNLDSSNSTIIDGSKDQLQKIKTTANSKVKDTENCSINIGNMDNINNTNDFMIKTQVINCVQNKKDSKKSEKKIIENVLKDDKIKNYFDKLMSNVNNDKPKVLKEKLLEDLSQHVNSKYSSTDDSESCDQKSSKKEKKKRMTIDGVDRITENNDIRTIEIHDDSDQFLTDLNESNILKDKLFKDLSQHVNSKNSPNDNISCIQEEGKKKKKKRKLSKDIDNTVVNGTIGGVHREHISNVDKSDEIGLNSKDESNSNPKVTRKHKKDKNKENLRSDNETEIEISDTVVEKSKNNHRDRDHISEKRSKNNSESKNEEQIFSKKKEKYEKGEPLIFEDSSDDFVINDNDMKKKKKDRKQTKNRASHEIFDQNIKNKEFKKEKAKVNTQDVLCENQENLGFGLDSVSDTTVIQEEYEPELKKRKKNRVNEEKNILDENHQLMNYEDHKVKKRKKSRNSTIEGNEHLMDIEKEYETKNVSNSSGNNPEKKKKKSSENQNEPVATIEPNSLDSENNNSLLHSEKYLGLMNVSTQKNSLEKSSSYNDVEYLSESLESTIKKKSKKTKRHNQPVPNSEEVVSTEEGEGKTKQQDSQISLSLVQKITESANKSQVTGTDDDESEEFFSKKIRKNRKRKLKETRENSSFSTATESDSECRKKNKSKLLMSVYGVECNNSRKCVNDEEKRLQSELKQMKSQSSPIKEKSQGGNVIPLKSTNERKKQIKTELKFSPTKKNWDDVGSTKNSESDNISIEALKVTEKSFETESIKMCSQPDPIENEPRASKSGNGDHEVSLDNSMQLKKEKKKRIESDLNGTNSAYKPKKRKDKDSESKNKDNEHSVTQFMEENQENLEAESKLTSLSSPRKKKSKNSKSIDANEGSHKLMECETQRGNRMENQCPKQSKSDTHECEVDTKRKSPGKRKNKEFKNPNKEETDVGLRHEEDVCGQSEDIFSETFAKRKNSSETDLFSLERIGIDNSVQPKEKFKKEKKKRIKTELEKNSSPPYSKKKKKNKDSESKKNGDNEDNKKQSVKENKENLETESNMTPQSSRRKKKYEMSIVDDYVDGNNFAECGEQTRKNLGTRSDFETSPKESNFGCEVESQRKSPGKKKNKGFKSPSREKETDPNLCREEDICFESEDIFSGIFTKRENSSNSDLSLDRISNNLVQPKESHFTMNEHVSRNSETVLKGNELNESFTFSDILSQTHNERLKEKYNEIVAGNTSNSSEHSGTKEYVRDELNSTSKSKPKYTRAGWKKQATLDKFLVKDAEVQSIIKKQTALELLQQDKTIEEIEEELEISYLDQESKIEDLHIEMVGLPMIHRIAHFLGHNPSSEQRLEIESAGIRMKTGKFTKAEDEKIKRRWNQFCEEHNWDKDHYHIFLQGSNLSKKGKLSAVQFRRFVQYISYEFEDRVMVNIYRRFRRLFSNRIKTNFTEQDDAIIEEYVNSGKSSTPFADLASILDKDRLSLIKRHSLKKSYMKNGNERIRWNKELTEKLLANLIEITRSINLSELKDRTITANEWKKISDNMNIPVEKLKRFWIFNFYPRFFNPNYESEKRKVKVKLIELLYERYNDYKEIDWNEVAKEFGDGFTAPKLTKLLHDLLARFPPNIRRNFRKAMKILMKSDNVVRNVKKFEFLEDILTETKNGTICPRIIRSEKSVENTEDINSDKLR